MTTPVFDFVKKYAKKNPLRLHMPGHKGRGVLGVEKYDITEIQGADSLFEANGIIAESEKNLSEIFGTRASFYSAEGSSLCIRAMLYLVMQNAKHRRVLAGRNAHKSFLSASALVDFEIDWIYGLDGSDLYTCRITPEYLRTCIDKGGGKYDAVYVTSPDYLGNMLDIGALSEVCHEYGIPLVVDNAHGAYLKFFDMHPMQLGADMCCDSAHKTLPVLTGGAYLHVSETCMYKYEENAKRALSLFASTSPSYLILSSLDAANKQLADEKFAKRIKNTEKVLRKLRKKLADMGYMLCSDEPMKLTVRTSKNGLTGTEMSEYLAKHGVVSEFCDKDNLTMMFPISFSFFNPLSFLSFLYSFCFYFRLFFLFSRCPLSHDGHSKNECHVFPPEKAVSVRSAMFSPCETVPVRESMGRILASPCVSCPPAIPIAVCGEIIDENAVRLFEYYGIDEICVIK